MTHLNEDGSETVEETPGDTGAQNKLLAAVASTVAAATSSTGGRRGQRHRMAGRRELHAHRSGAAHRCCPPDKSKCWSFFGTPVRIATRSSPRSQTWLKSKPAYITFIRVPVEWNEGHRSLARLFYALEAMGKLNELHSEIFKEIQVNGDPLLGS